jgi:predicted transglutaminase-like cysteine proteinase
LVVALCLLTAASQAQAWDAGRMQAAARRQGAGAVAALPALLALLAPEGPGGEDAWVAAVNGFFNRRIAFRPDIEVWGVADYWASPLESLGRGAGDCEDYAIAKFFTLLAAGVPGERLRLVYVRATLRGGDAAPRMQPHMVLAWYPSRDADPMILDNLRPDIVPAAQRADLTPVFAFNHEVLWLGAATAGDPASRLSPWREVLAKARAEGFL